MDSIILSITFGVFREDFLGSDQKEAFGAKWEQNALRKAFRPIVIMIGDFDCDSLSNQLDVPAIALSFVNRKYHW